MTTRPPIDDRVVALADGSRTARQIAAALGVSVQRAQQIRAEYRSHQT